MVLLDLSSSIIRRKNKLFTQETLFKKTSYKMVIISEHGGFLFIKGNSMITFLSKWNTDLFSLSYSYRLKKKIPWIERSQNNSYFYIYTHGSGSSFRIVWRVLLPVRYYGRCLPCVTLFNGMGMEKTQTITNLPKTTQPHVSAPHSCSHHL